MTELQVVWSKITRNSVTMSQDRVMNTPTRRVLVTGATGFVGRSLCLRLAREGWQVLAWARSPARARAALGAEVEVVPQVDGDVELRAALARVDAVVHLAGENLFGGRWTERRKRLLVDSRVALTRRLVRALAECGRPPATLVSASAIGLYGERGDEVLTEESTPGVGFLAELCRGWEVAGREAEALGTRVAHLRLGIVLGAEGGALARMLPPFRLGAGGRLGHGRQWMSWIQLDDLLSMFAAALQDARWRGAFNAVAPEPATNTDFTRALGRALSRPTVLPAPAAALKLALGEAAEVLLASQRVVPRRALELGFRFDCGDLRTALAAELAPPSGFSIGPARDVPDAEYLRQRPPAQLLSSETWIDAPLEQVFAFFSRAENLGAMTPPSLAFEIRTELPIEMRAGAQIDYRIRLGPLPLSWRTRIEAWTPGRRFVDVQLSGPYASWYHEHRFEADGERTRMIDRVWYAAPLGALGRAAQGLAVEPQLRAIFAFRAKAIARRFGRAGDGASRASTARAVANGV
jgi:uncharacterized protein (TIGR01777 family)